MTSPTQERPVIGSVCTGYGGLDLGALAAFGTGRLAWVADPDPHVRTILATRFPNAPNHGDITEVDWERVEPVDVLTAGFPCQDLSSSGRRAGIREGTRSGLWYSVVRAVRVLRPAFTIVENVAAIRWHPTGLGVVLGELAAIGYDATWTSVRASDIGAAHRRERLFLLAHPTRQPPPDWLTDPTGPRVAHAIGRGRSPGRDEPGTPQEGWSSGEPGRRDHTPDLLPFRPGGGANQAGTGGQVAVVADPGRHRDPQEPGRDPRLPVRSQPGPGHRDRDRYPTGRTGRANPTTSVAASVDWGPYEPAIRRWEHLRGLTAPSPTEPGRRGPTRLSARFVEWLMGLPPGWVTNTGIAHTAQIRALGNGVVPGQAAHAIRILLTDLLTHCDHAEVLAA